jgi:hypothetical protein
MTLTVLFENQRINSIEGAFDVKSKCPAQLQGSIKYLNVTIYQKSRFSISMLIC